MIFSLLYDIIRYTIITYSLLQPIVWLDIVVFIYVCYIVYMTLSSSYIMCVYRTLFVTVCACHTGLIKATCLLAFYEFQKMESRELSVYGTHR